MDRPKTLILVNLKANLVFLGKAVFILLVSQDLKTQPQLN